MKYRDPSTGNFKDLHFKVSDTVPIGAKMLWHSTTAPEGWLICDGSAVSRTTYSALFAVIGTTYGSGNGSTTFNLPDYRDRVPVGYDANDSDFNAIGKKVGAKSNSYNLAHTHTSAAHTHTSANHRHALSDRGWANIGFDEGYLYQDRTYKGTTKDIRSMNIDHTKSTYQNTSTTTLGGYTDYVTPGNTGSTTPGNTGSALGSTSISTIQSSLVDVFIIKAYQHVAAPGKVRNTYSNNTDDVYSTSYVNSIIESGSNENGNYIKYVDGTMICYGLLSLTVSDSRSAGGLTYYSSAETITLPVSYIDTAIRGFSNVDMANMNYFSQSYLSVTSSSQITLSFTSTDSNETRNIHWMTIGKWK